jgi:superfamily II DNA helicase RecQ
MSPLRYTVCFIKSDKGYFYFTSVIQKVFTLPQNFTIVALTATATAEVQQDIMSKLSIGQNDVVKTSTKRRNICNIIHNKFLSLISRIDFED